MNKPEKLFLKLVELSIHCDFNIGYKFASVLYYHRRYICCCKYTSSCCENCKWIVEHYNYSLEVKYWCLFMKNVTKNRKSWRTIESEETKTYKKEIRIVGWPEYIKKKLLLAWGILKQESMVILCCFLLVPFSYLYFTGLKYAYVKTFSYFFWHYKYWVYGT